MPRRWIHSADIEVDERTGALLVESRPPSSLAGGTKTVASAAVAQPLVAAGTPCRFVWVGPRLTTAGVTQNTGPVFIGDAAGQNLPVMPGNVEGLVIAVDDASKLYVRVATAGDGVAYRVFS